MADSRKDLPAPGSSNFDARTREEVMRLMGRMGDKMDRAVTLRDLAGAGIVSVSKGYLNGGSGSPVSGPGPNVGGGAGTAEPEEPDLTMPPIPSGFGVIGGLTHVFVECSAPLYLQGHGHAVSVLYGVTVTPGDPEPMFTDAVQLATFPGSVYAYPSDPSLSWRMWLTWKSRDGVESLPAGGINGLAVETGQNVGRLLDTLAGQITATELDASLSTPIGMIPGLASDVSGSLASIDAIQAELAELSGTPDYDPLEPYAEDDIVRYSGGLYRAIGPTTGNLPTDPAFWVKIGDYSSLGDAVAAHAVALADHETRIASTESGLVAEAAARTLLAADVAGNTAAVATEAATRASADSALSSQITTVRSRVAANVGITQRLYWGFDAGTELWYSSNSTLVGSAGVLTWTPSGANPTIGIVLATPDRYIGALATVIRTRVRRVSGTGAWEGNCYYTTDVHGNLAGFRKQIAQPADPAAWNELEWDMAALTAGGTDYVDSEIRALRIDLVSDGPSSVWEIDWVAVGTRSVTPLDAALQVEASTRALQTGELYAQYTVKTDVAGLVSGYGLASTANNAAPSSAFGVRASQFFVAPPALAQTTAPTLNLYKGMVWLDTGVLPAVSRYYTGSSWSTTPQALPFVVQVAPTVINGETVPPGVYMEAAFMARLVATRGQIGLLSVDDARIASMSASKIVAGSISVGEYVQSTGYVPTSAGWRINGNGTAEFSGVVVRGTIYASAGQIGGSTIGATYIRSTTYSLGVSGWNFNSDGTGQVGGISMLNDALQSFNFVTGSTGWRLRADGSIEASTGEFRGTVKAGMFITGAFSGYGWPAAGGANHGAYLGPSGLRVGNLNNGKWFQVSADGDISAPGFSVVNGVLTISQANVINTLNIAGNAVSVSNYASGNNGAATNINIPAGATATVMAIVVKGAGGTATSGLVPLSLSVNIGGSVFSTTVHAVSIDDGLGGTTGVYPNATLTGQTTIAGPATVTVTATFPIVFIANPVSLIVLARWK